MIKWTNMQRLFTVFLLELTKTQRKTKTTNLDTYQ